MVDIESIYSYQHLGMKKHRFEERNERKLASIEYLMNVQSQSHYYLL